MNYGIMSDVNGLLTSNPKKTNKYSLIKNTNFNYAS